MLGLKRHKHKPVDPSAVNILRAVKQSDQSLRWRCTCGKMIDDLTGEVIDGKAGAQDEHHRHEADGNELSG